MQGQVIDTGNDQCFVVRNARLRDPADADLLEKRIPFVLPRQPTQQGFNIGRQRNDPQAFTLSWMVIDFQVKSTPDIRG